MFSFSHAGKMGDILYSLYFCCEISSYYQYDQFDYNIQINRKRADFEKNSAPDEILLSRKDGEFIRPLLESQPYVRTVTVCEEPGKDSVSLNSFRNGHISPVGCEIRDWYYNFSRVTLPRAFWKPIIHVEPDFTYRDKILFTLTERYVNSGLDYTELKEFRDHLVFIGTDREYQVFQNKYFELDRAELKPEDSLLTVARYLAGAKGYVSNQTSFFALAELMKVNRILFAPDWVEEKDKNKVSFGPKNNLPLGGWANNVSFHPRMKAAVKELVEM
jgi:hypothetical protein